MPARYPRPTRNSSSPAARWRLYTVVTLFSACYLMIGARLVMLAQNQPEKPLHTASTSYSKYNHRPDIVDRNGKLLASDVTMQSLVADPKKIVDVDDALEKITAILPGLEITKLRRRLEERLSRFAWVKRGLTPKEAAMIHDLGIPGLRFIEEPRRVYPAGRTAAHIVGQVDIDNRGRAGMEAYIDKIQGIYFPNLKDPADKPPLQTSIDLGVQHIVRQRLLEAIDNHRAKSGAATVMDIHTGEVIAMVSLPDYDPNHPAEALEEGRFNRLANGTFELGSIFKTITTAMALEIGGAKLDDRFDATEPLKVGKFTIRDYHAENRVLTLSEIFTYSSNIGSALLAGLVGPQKHREFLGSLGLLGPLQTELGPIRAPQAPQKWRKLRSMTISYGHGIAVAPLQFVSASAPLFNGGKALEPTFLKRKSTKLSVVQNKLISDKTTRALRKLMRLNVTKGTAKKADAKGYSVGGKTGTAEKVVDGKYAKRKLLNTFLAIFPSEEPQYIVFAMLDEPQPDPQKPNIRPTAGLTTAPLAKDIISQIAPMLSVLPNRISTASY